MKTVVLAYSGGLDTSVCIPLLKERYDCDRGITVVADRSALRETQNVIRNRLRWN
ncbi:MAG: argininosuccinate synthase [archaeon]|nr:argininosuccinate synthase [archaeon]